MWWWWECVGEVRGDGVVGDGGEACAGLWWWFGWAVMVRGGGVGV